MNKILPINPPPIKGYYHYLYPLSILARSDDYLPWFYSNYIQLFYVKYEKFQFYVHPFSISPKTKLNYYTTCPLLDVQSIDYCISRSLIGDSIAFITDCINNGYYVQIDVDDYCIPYRDHYKRSHYLHELLINGYCADRQAFLCSGYTKGRYSTFEVPFCDIFKALSTPRDVYLEHFNKSGIIRPRFVENMRDRPLWILYKYNGSNECCFDFKVTYEQLSDYYSSTDSSRKYNLLVRSIDNTMWGMECYNYLIEVLENSLNDPTQYSPIPMRILYEHKSCMLQRLKYMETHGYLCQSDSLSESYARVFQQAHNLHLVMFRWLKNNSASTISYVIDSLRKISIEEHRLLDIILNKLRRQYCQQ
jgi:hypothetical protein